MTHPHAPDPSHALLPVLIGCAHQLLVGACKSGVVPGSCLPVFRTSFTATLGDMDRTTTPRNFTVYFPSRGTVDSIEIV